MIAPYAAEGGESAAARAGIAQSLAKAQARRRISAATCAIMQGEAGVSRLAAAIEDALGDFGARDLRED
jgi:hypothetical protein